MIDFSAMPLLDVAKLNTPEALDYFWSHVDDGYFEDRAWFYNYVARECDKISIETDLIVMDVGCALGHQLGAICEKFGTDIKYCLGIDYSEVAIQRAEQLWIDVHFQCERIDFDEEISPKLANSFNLITCIQTLEHIQAWQIAIRNMIAFVKSGGYLVITIPNGAADTYDGHINFWTEDEMREHLSQYGAVESWQFNDGKNLFFHVRKTE